MSNKKYIGSRKKADDISYEYLRLSQEDEKAGQVLLQAKNYRAASYSFVQAMEKHVRYMIFKKVNAHTEGFLQRTRTHNLDELLTFLIEITTPKEALRKQVMQQLDEHVLKGVRFGQLHNELRYPHFHRRNRNYTILECGQKDAEECCEKLKSLKVFLEDIEKLR